MSRKRGRGDLVEYASMARRVVRAYGKRFAQEGDLEDLAQLSLLAEEIDAQIVRAVGFIRSNPKLARPSWNQIGAAVGMTGENARKKWAEETYPIGRVIYGLRARGTTEYRYVGQTVNLGLRMETYRQRGGHSIELMEWLMGDGFGFEFDVLDHADSDEALDAAEVLWINKLRAEGHYLVNVMPGGRRKWDNFIQCDQEEMRWVTGRRVPPMKVRCSLPIKHPGECKRSGVAFGTQPPKSAWTIYLDRVGPEMAAKLGGAALTVPIRTSAIDA